MESDQSNFIKLFWGTLFFSLLFIISCVSIFVFLPSRQIDDKPAVIVKNTFIEEATEPVFSYNDYLTDIKLSEKINSRPAKQDNGLNLYRQQESKAAVEWFYTHVTGSRETAMAILEYADKNDIPLPLAFSLAHTESNYNVTAIHRNSNDSIDRGLFQLNSKTFPALSEEAFYDPQISARYGLSHLRFCMNTAGNEIAALAMYNAGTNKVRNNGTPQVTLNYISQIEDYRDFLDETFSTEVVAFYAPAEEKKLLAKK